MHADLPFPAASRTPGHALRLLYRRWDDRTGCSALSALLAVLALSVSCARPELVSHWRHREIQIDGALKDWQGMQVALQGFDARLAVANDESYLYLSLATSDPHLVRQLSRQGVTVWFDPAAGQAEVLGLRLPPASGAWGYQGPEPPRDPAGAGEAPSEARRPPRPPSRGPAVELIGPGRGERRWLSGAQLEASGVQSAQVREGSLVFEVRVPLSIQGGWGVRVPPGGRLGLGVTAGEGAGPFGGEEEEGSSGSRDPLLGGGSGRPQVGGGPLGGPAAGGAGVERPGIVTGGPNRTGGFDSPGAGSGIDSTGGFGVPSAEVTARPVSLEVWTVLRLASPGGG